LFTVGINQEKTGMSRDQFLEQMTKRNIGTGVHYLAIPEHPFYQKEFGWNPSDYPHAQHYGRETVSLPISPKLSNQDFDDIVHAVKDIL